MLIAIVDGKWVPVPINRFKAETANKIVKSSYVTKAKRQTSRVWRHCEGGSVAVLPA